MNPDLESLVRALDAVLTTENKSERERLREVFEGLLARTAEKQRVSNQALDAAVRFQYFHWVKSQKRPPTLPPNA